MIKIPKNVETDFINQVKHICENLTANIELNVEKLKVFLFKMKRRWSHSPCLLSTVLEHLLG